MRTALTEVTLLVLTTLLVPIAHFAISEVVEHRLAWAATGSHATLAPEPLRMPEP